MRRITTGFLLALAAAFTIGCGGSSAPLGPGDGGNNNGGSPGAAGPQLELQKPESISGGHSVTHLPGQVNVVAGGTEEQLMALADGYGYSVLKYDNGYATLLVPEGQEQDAVARLQKEYTIITAEPVRVINTPKLKYEHNVKASSFYPQFPQYAELFGAFFYDGTTASIANYFTGQSLPYNIQKFNGGWDVTVANNAVASQPVKIAIIDSGWWDFSTQNQPGLNDVADDATVPGTVLDVTNSGAVDGSGNFTPGLTAAAWEMDSNGDPYRTTGNVMLGMLAGGSDGFVATVRAFDLDGDTIIQEDEVWNEGIMGANPNAEFVLIKTGSGDGTTWSFTDNEIAESIDHAVASGANIILLGMFAPGTVSANISTAIANARNSDILVIAPAGDVVDTFDGTDWTGTPVDIQTDSFTPSSDPNVVSVAATGTMRIGQLNDVDFGDGPIPNLGTGWLPNFGTPIDSTMFEVANYSNFGATIAGIGYGMGFGPRPFLVGGAGEVLPGFNYTLTLDRFGTANAAAYVAGAASMVYQTLSEINGTPPTDDEVLAVLLSSVQLRGMTGVDDPSIVGPDDGGLLDAGLAVTTAVNGGSLITPLPAMELTTLQLSQPFGFVTRGTDVALTVNVINGSDPLTLTVDWGDGTQTVVDPWTSGTPVTKTGGYANLGLFAINILVEDDNGLTESFAVGVDVHNPLAATITVENSSGASVPPTALKVGTTYRFNSNVSNVYSGDGNVTNYAWDFNNDGTPDATGPTPTFAYPSAGNNTITLTITESLRPNTVRTLDVIVAP